MKLPVIIKEESVGGFSVSIPALPGCFSQGETREEALENIREAAELWLEVASESAVTRAKSESQQATLQEIEI